MSVPKGDIQNVCSRERLRHEKKNRTEEKKTVKEREREGEKKTLWCHRIHHIIVIGGSEIASGLIVHFSDTLWTEVVLHGQVSCRHVQGCMVIWSKDNGNFYSFIYWSSHQQHCVVLSYWLTGVIFKISIKPQNVTQMLNVKSCSDGPYSAFLFGSMHYCYFVILFFSPM